MANSLKNKSFNSSLTWGFSAFLTASLAVVAFSLPTSALAQEGAAGALLEEIVTIARKRSEAEVAQDVPIAITALGAEQIEALFVRKLDDLSYMMPNVQLEAVGTFPGVQNFSIRGQGINSSIPSVDPTVGVFVDGIYLGTTYGVVLDTFDLERIEVLRGPQGLLFGRNVTGGAVILRNARPDGEFGAKVRVGLDDEEQFNVAAAIEGAIVEDKFFVKLVVYRDDDSGYFQNNNQLVPVDPATATFPAPHPLQPFYIQPATRQQVGEMETTLIRPTFVFRPSDDLEVTLIYENGSTEGDGAVWTSVSLQRAGAQADFSTTADEIGFTDIEWNQTTLEINLDELWGGTLTSITGFREVDADSAADIDGTLLPIFSAPGFTAQDQFSTELRWSGQISDTWSTTVGLYYFEQDINYREARYIWLPPSLAPPAGVNLTRALGGDMQADNFGLFWNNDFDMSDVLTVSAGIRYTDESKTAQIITGLCADVVTFVCTFDNLQGDWDNITPKLGFQYSFADAAHVYGFWSKGFRSGGFNFRNAKPNVIPPGPTKEEENNTFELGLKSEFADGRARVNVAVFHNEIKDMQRELNIGDPDVIVLQGTINAGDVTITGLEVDAVWLPIDNLSLFVSAGWQQGEYDRIDPFVDQISAALGAPVLGPELPRLAENNYNLGFSWDISMGNAGLINVAGNYSFRKEHPYNDSNTERFSDQRRSNASINWYSPNESWQVSVYGKNLGDEANWGNLTSIAGLWTAGPMQKGRIIGAEIQYRMR